MTAQQFENKKYKKMFYVYVLLMSDIVHSTKYVTTHYIPDGFGSQFQTLLYAIIFTLNDKKEFVYTPLKHVEHNYDNDPYFNEKLENLINIRPHFKTMEDFNEEQQQKVELYDGIQLKNKMDANMKEFMTPEALNRIRNIFWGNKERDYFKNGKINVAIHIRRPNEYDETILEENKKQFGYFQRYNTNEYFLRIIHTLRNRYCGNEIQFHIYSQNNKRASFDCFISEDTQLHIDEDICSTFVGLAAADILVTSASSFSYVAGLLNYGTIIYCPFWHPPHPDWVIIS